MKNISLCVEQKRNIERGEERTRWRVREVERETDSHNFEEDHPIGEEGCVNSWGDLIKLHISQRAM